MALSSDIRACRHPSPDTLTDFAAGVLAPGAALVVELHLALCPRCAGEVGYAGGSGRAPASPSNSDGIAWPQEVRRPEAAPWRWAGRGLEIALVQGAAGIGEHLYLTRAEPGVALPRHRHQGAERTIVLEGAFLDGSNRFERGDLLERFDDGWHRPQVSEGGACVCLVATDGPLELSGVGRWLQGYLGV